MNDDRRSPLEMHPLQMRWVPVTDARGRTHMEAVWIVMGEPAGSTQAA